MFSKRSNIPIAILGVSQSSPLSTTIIDASSIELSRSNQRRAQSLVNALSNQLEKIGLDPSETKSKGLKFHLVSRTLFDGLSAIPTAKTISNDVLLLKLREPMETHIFVDEGGVRSTNLEESLRRAIEDGGR